MSVRKPFIGNKLIPSLRWVVISSLCMFLSHCDASLKPQTRQALQKRIAKVLVKVTVNAPLFNEDFWTTLWLWFADVATVKKDVWIADIKICLFAINTLRVMTKILMKRTSDRMLWVEWIKMNTIFTDLSFQVGESTTFSSLSTVVTLVGEVSGSKPGCRGEVLGVPPFTAFKWSCRPIFFDGYRQTLN